MNGVPMEAQIEKLEKKVAVSRMWAVQQGPQKWQFDHSLMCENAKPIGLDFKVNLPGKYEVLTANIRIWLVARKRDSEHGEEGNDWGFFGEAVITGPISGLTARNIFVQGNYSTASPRVGEIWEIPDMASIDTLKLLLK